MRTLTAMLALALFTPAVRAHFVFVYVPDGSTEARLVFGHGAAPDPSIFPTRAENTKLVARDEAGKEVKLKHEKGDGNFLRAMLPATKTVVVYGTTDAGVTQRGDNPPMLSWYYPKVIVGDPFAARATVGSAVALEIIPERVGDQVRFRVLADDKPVPDVEVSAGLSGAEEDDHKTVKTDKDGRTEGFTERGRYCVAVRRAEEKAGERDGKKYAAVRHIATLVFDFAGSGK